MRHFIPFVAIVIAAASGSSSGQQDALEAKKIVIQTGQETKDAYEYRLLRPETIEKGRRYPLVLFLHGAGERGEDNEKQTAYLPRSMASPEMRKRFPCFLLAPQCRRGKKWVEVPWSDEKSTPAPTEPSAMMKMALATLKRTIADCPIDTERIYLTGLSMGGYGSWYLAARRPELFAAALPICGGGDERQAERLVGLPIWAVHGDADRAVPVARSRHMVKAIRRAGGKPRYSEFGGVGHNSWTRAYRVGEGILSWLFEQRRPPSEAGLDGLTAKGSSLRDGDRIAFLGDSITEAGAQPGGYLRIIEERLHSSAGGRKFEVIPAGISGHKVPDLIERLDRDVLDKKPDVVLIYIGINDVWHGLSGSGTSKDRYESGLREILVRIAKAGAKTVIATPSVIGEKLNGRNQLDETLDEFAAISRKVAAESGAGLCDLRRDFVEYLRMHNPEDRDRGVLTTDGVHLNARGNRFVADRVAAALAAASR